MLCLVSTLTSRCERRSCRQMRLELRNTRSSHSQLLTYVQLHDSISEYRGCTMDRLDCDTIFNPCSRAERVHHGTMQNLKQVPHHKCEAVSLNTFGLSVIGTLYHWFSIFFQRCSGVKDTFFSQVPPDQWNAFLD